MIQRIFSGDKLPTAGVLFFFSILLWLPAFFGKIQILDGLQNDPMPFYGLIYSWAEKGGFASILISFLFIGIQSYILIFLNGRFMLIQQRTFLPAFFFIGIISFYPGLQGISEAMIAGFFMILVVALLFDSYNREANTWRFFEVGLLLGLGSLFYAKMILFLPFVWITTGVFRPFHWREWVLPVLGLILPYLFVVGINFLLDQDPWHVFYLLGVNLLSDAIVVKFNPPFFIMLGILSLLILIASIYMLKIFQFRKIYIRNYYLSFFWLFIFSLAAISFSGLDDIGIVFILAIPVSFILSNYFMNSHKNFGNKVLFTLFFLALLLNTLNTFVGII